MGIQLPDAALSTAIGVLIFSLICMLCSVLMIWLVCAHHEWDSYVGLLSYFTLLSTGASIIQQLHTMIFWTDIKTAQYYHAIANIGSVEIALAGASLGLDLGLFYTQYYAYNVEALLTMCWAGALAHSIFGFADIAAFKAIQYKTNTGVKIASIVLPAILLGLLRVPSVKNDFVGFMIVGNICMMVGLTVGIVLLLAILGKYVHTRRLLLSWNVQYGGSTGSQSQPSSRVSLGGATRHTRSIYDRWLMVRFTITFMMLGIFELLSILFQVSSSKTNTLEHLGDHPNVSASRAIGDFVLFMPGCCASLLLFIVFGTTKPFRDHMKKTFIPRRFLKDTTTRTAHAPAATPLSSQSRKPAALSLHTDDGLYTQTDDGSIVRLREIDFLESPRETDDDEWPILTTTTRVNGALV
ncbi:hypothetical protein BJ170DRAFT_677815 [Xylariales sp. AK1849]|nr:hypothetical protein BJ170DRAFT_677815 [Xylariales sp. AK1849]